MEMNGISAQLEDWSSPTCIVLLIALRVSQTRTTACTPVLCDRRAARLFGEAAKLRLQFAETPPDGVQYEPYAKRKDADQHQTYRKDRRWQTVHLSVVIVLDEYPDAGNEARSDKQQADSAKDNQRPVIPKEDQNRAKNPETVVHQTQLGMAALGSVSEIDRKLYDREIALQRLDRNLCFGLEPAAEERQTLYKARAENAIPREQVREPYAEHRVQKQPEDLVSDSIYQSEIAVGVLVKTGADHHIRFAAQNRLDHLTYCLRRVRAVPVDHHVDVGLHSSEHRLNDISLSLSPFVVDLRPGPSSRFRGSIRRVVIE